MDRECRSAVSDDDAAGEFLQERPRARDVGAEAIRRQRVEQLVAVAVRCDFVTFFGDPLDEGRATVCDPAEDEARRMDASL